MTRSPRCIWRLCPCRFRGGVQLICGCINSAFKSRRNGREHLRVNQATSHLRSTTPELEVWSWQRSEIGLVFCYAGEVSPESDGVGVLQWEYGGRSCGMWHRCCSGLCIIYLLYNIQRQCSIKRNPPGRSDRRQQVALVLHLA